MSGQVHAVGSVLNFWPDPPASDTDVVTGGVVLVVVAREWSVVTTELRRVYIDPDNGGFVVLEPQRKHAS